MLSQHDNLIVSIAMARAKVDEIEMLLYEARLQRQATQRPLHSSSASRFTAGAARRQSALKTKDNSENSEGGEDQEDPSGFIVAVIKNATEIADRGDVSRFDQTRLC